MNRYALAGLLALPLACASSPGRASNGELYLEVETTTALGYVEFINHETGNTARAVAIPEGTSEHTVSVRAGEWCLFEVSLGMGAVGHALRPRNPRCVEVQPQSTAIWGRIAFDGENVNLFALPPAPPRT